MILFVISAFLLCKVTGVPIAEDTRNETETQPWLASIQADNYHFCGGSIISENVILTSAHCVAKYSLDSLSVRVNTSRVNEGGSKHKVVDVKIHENFTFSGPTMNDIALMKVSPPFTLGNDVTTVKLASEGGGVEPDTVASSAGWGRTSEGEKSLAILKNTSVRIVDRTKCATDYGKLFLFWYTNAYMMLLSNSTICATAPPTSHCKDGCGGPLVADGVQIGIVVWSTGCAGPDHPGVYTNVAFYRDWIDRNLKTLNSAPEEVSFSSVLIVPTLKRIFWEWSRNGLMIN